MSLRIATWNVNSLRQRLDHLARFAAEAAPDVICLFVAERDRFLEWAKEPTSPLASP